MDFLNGIFRSLIEGYTSLFGEAHPLVSLIPLSVAIGIAMLWVFGKTSNQRAIARAKKKMQAYLLELRLFGDDPSLLFKAQGKLIASNLRYLGLMFQPALILTIPMVFLLVHLDAVYGVSALPQGESAIVTLQATGRLPPTIPTPELEAPPGVEVETAGVRALDQGQFSWRIKAVEPADGALRFTWRGESFEKEIRAGGPWTYVSHRRASGFWDAILYGGEERVQVQHVDWIDVAYPGTSIETGGFRLHWLVWFLVLSIVAAYLLKGVFGVAV